MAFFNAKAPRRKDPRKKIILSAFALKILVTRRWNGSCGVSRFRKWRAMSGVVAKKPRMAAALRFETAISNAGQPDGF